MERRQEMLVCAQSHEHAENWEEAALLYGQIAESYETEGKLTLAASTFIDAHNCITHLCKRRALDFIGRAIQLFTEDGNHFERACALWIRAMLFSLLGQNIECWNDFICIEVLLHRMSTTQAETFRKFRNEQVEWIRRNTSDK